MNEVELIVRSTSPSQTRHAASILAEVVELGDLIILSGDLGAGKTCFTQGIGQGLGVVDQITSPTFTLASQYQGTILLHHLDAYRLDTLGEALDLDLPELLETGVTVIEWGELLAPVLPNDHVLIAIEYVPHTPEGSSEVEASEWPSDDLRTLRITSAAPRWVDRLLIVAEKLVEAGLIAETTSKEASE